VYHFLKSAHLVDLPVFQEQDAVNVFDGRQAVGDDHNGVLTF
jgi:hypothetical protein